MKILPHLLRPARGGSAALIIVFALILSIAAHAGLLGIPAAFIVTSWFFKYAYILFDHTVWGYEEPPTLDISMVNPVDEQRPLAQLLILGVIYVAVKSVASHGSPAAAAVLATLAALTLPASVAVLGLERNILLALYPPALARIIRGLGLAYVGVLALIGIYVAGIGLLVSRMSFLPLEFALSMFGMLSLFSILGGALYERREQLGLETRRSPERSAELERRADQRAADDMVTEAYGLVRVGSHAKALAMLEGWLASRGPAVADYEWLCKRVSSWNDARYANRLTQDYVEKLLVLQEFGRAVDVVAERHAADPSFRPRTADSTWRIAELAAQAGGRRRLARELLADFEARFPDSPVCGAARALAEHLAS